MRHPFYVEVVELTDYQVLLFFFAEVDDRGQRYDLQVEVLTLGKN